MCLLGLSLRLTRETLGKEIYHLGNHPIKWVRLTGVIIAIDEFFARRILTIDDSSGMCIECTCPAASTDAASDHTHLNQASTSNLVTLTAEEPKVVRPAAQQTSPTVEMPLVPWLDVEVGRVVKVKGKPGTFREMKQVEIIKVEMLRATEQEVRCWNEVLAFRKQILSTPWVISQEEEKKCRKRASKEKQYKSDAREGRKEEQQERKRKNEGRTETTGEKLIRRNEKGDRLRQIKERLMGDGLLVQHSKATYSSLAVRRVAGKYDALGI